MGVSAAVPVPVSSSSCSSCGACAAFVQHALPVLRWDRPVVTGVIVGASAALFLLASVYPVKPFVVAIYAAMLSVVMHGAGKLAIHFKPSLKDTLQCHGCCGAAAGASAGNQ